MPTLPTYEKQPEPTRRKPVHTYGVPIDGALALRNCEVGKSFVVDSKIERMRLLRTAARLKIPVTSQAIDDGRYRIWRKAK